MRGSDESEPSPEFPYDPTERFTAEELDEALMYRTRVSPDPKLRRRDHCPHTPQCPNVHVCIEEIAWYLRHRREIEAQS